MGLTVELTGTHRAGLVMECRVNDTWRVGGNVLSGQKRGKRDDAMTR